MKKHFIVILSLICLIFSTRSHCFAQSFYRVNTSYKYNPYTPIHFNYKIEKQGKQYIIHTLIKLNWDGNFDNSYKLSYSTTKSYKTLIDFQQTPLISENSTKQNLKDGMYLKFALPKNEINKLVILHVKTLDGRHQYLYDINLNDKSKQIDMENFEFDFLKSYISLNKIDAINTPSLNHQHVRLAIPEKELKEALPAIEATHNKQNYEDSTYFIPLIEASTSSQEGLYILQSDFQPNNKQYLVKGVENDFPKYNEIEDLIGPIKYIATKKEYEKISKSIDPKKSFDKFWISLTRSEKRAQYHVKKFYKQVTNANKLFTNLKDGWKTDRGMVYIIFGPPNEVYKNGKKEEWTYLTVDNFKIKFTFVNKKSLLSGSEYKLKRRKRYKRVWLREKDLWRNDRKEI